jgi:hypothetical protein
MNIMPSISILLAGSGLIAILAALLWYVSEQARLELARLAKARLAHMHEPQLGAYEKARIERYLNEVNAGRMTFEQAQQAIATEWIAAYWPMLHSGARTGGQPR